MAVFPCIYFLHTTRYPESGTRIALANSYDFTTAPVAPDQRIFTLTLQGMAYFTVSGVLSASPSPERNLKNLEDFYATHRLWKSFDFNHPVYGTVVCKFNTPLELPKGIVDGGGMVEDFDIQLREQP